jgi:glycosyltransferase involved in cell wall biosynthesis
VGEVNRHDVVIVVPCYNEEARLPLPAFVEYLRHPDGADLLFVDDGSADGTAELLNGLCTQFSERATLLRLSPNKGKAEAVRAGMLRAFSSQAHYAGFWDADLSTPLDAIRQLMAEFEADDRVEIVMGSRVKLLGRRIERRPLRHYFGRIFATAVSTLLVLPVYDTQCGAKIFRVTPDIQEVFASPFLSRWFFDVEILARLIVLRHSRSGPPAAESVRETPLREWRDVSGSKLRAGDVLRVPADLWRIRRWMVRALARPPAAGGRLT